jgi:tetratricopeptide (TPR) repeat protein
VKRLALLLVLTAASTAAAQPTAKRNTDATTAYKEGQRRYLDEDYLGAAAQFETAYKLDPDPVYLFNIAQAYRLAKDCAKALAHYKQFIAAVPKAPNADAVNKYIAELERACPQRESASNSTQPLSLDARTAADSSTTDTRGTDNIGGSDDPARPSQLRRNLGIGALGVGAIGVTAGIVFTFKVRGYEADREALCPAPCDWTPDDMARETELKQDGDRASKLAITSYVVGGLAIAAGAALLITAPRRADMVTIVPTQGGAFATFTARK